MSIYRKSSLERLSSPEEIDQLMQVTSPRSWFALCAIFLLIAVGTIWGFLGAVATTIAGQGAIVRYGGVRNVVTDGDGLLSQLDVHVGDHVSRGEVVAHIEQPQAVQKLDLLRRALEEAEHARADAMQVNLSQTRLQLTALGVREQNARQQIGRITDQIKLAEEQVRIEDGLQQKGLVTRRQVVDARQQLAGLQTERANRQAEINQIESDRFSWQKKPDEADVEQKEHVLTLQASVAEEEQKLEVESRVISPYDGEIIEVKASSGERLSTQTPVLSVQPAINNLEVVAYIPSLHAKEVRPGMEAQISPSIVKREEYGFMRGRVLSVGAFPATRAALMHNFENENLITALSSEAPVTELHIEMNADPATTTGFRWSSSKGPPLHLSGGMLCSLQIVTLRQRPLALLLPFLRQQLGTN